MRLMMNVINVNNGTSGHFDSENDAIAPPMKEDGTMASGKFENVNGSGERSRRKRKTRRFKSRYKNKSSKKSKFGVLKKMRSRIYPQSEAPNNTNQFLMADHNNLENLDDKLAVPDFARDTERTRARESSFTSVDSDDQYYTSAEDDDDEYLAKDFDNTYQSVCAEKFGNLPKAQLTKIIFDLEAKIEELSKKVVDNSKISDMSNILLQVNGMENEELIIRIKDILLENEKLRSESERLRKENEELKKLGTTSSSSSAPNSDDSDSESSESEKNSAKNQRPSSNMAEDLT